MGYMGCLVGYAGQAPDSCFNVGMASQTALLNSYSTDQYSLQKTGQGRSGFFAISAFLVRAASPRLSVSPLTPLYKSIVRYIVLPIYQQSALPSTNVNADPRLHDQGVRSGENDQKRSSR